MSYMMVAFGGFFGSIARFYLSQTMKKAIIGTWIANITGSILLAFIAHFYFVGSFSHPLWLFLGIGFCGAYTTFSTFGYETLQLLLNQKYGAAIGYAFSSLVVSLVFVWLVLSLLA